MIFAFIFLDLNLFLKIGKNETKKISFVFFEELKARKNCFWYFVTFKDTEKTIYEEILVYDQSGFVYQLGGVISLFLGFSFFTVICDVLEIIEKKFK